MAVNGIVATRKILKAVTPDTGDCDSEYTAFGKTFTTQHACFIALYKEDSEVIRQTLLSLADQKGKGLDGESFARSFVGVNLCYEEREGESGPQQANC